MGIPDHLTCLLRNLYGGQQTTVRTGHETKQTDFKLGKEYGKLYITTLFVLGLCGVHHGKWQTG